MDWANGFSLVFKRHRVKGGGDSLTDLNDIDDDEDEDDGAATTKVTALCRYVKAQERSLVHEIVDSNV